MKIGIKNFQILENVQLDVDGIVLITGRNNSGKTSVYRAIRAFITNQSSEAHIRDGAGVYVVGVKDEGREVVYRKSRRDGNSYIIDKETYTKLGKKKLSDVLPDFGIREIAVGNGSYAYPNFIPFGELGFPFNLTDADIYSIFYKYMGLGEVEAILDDVSMEVKRLKKERAEKEGAFVYIQNSIVSAEKRFALYMTEDWYTAWRDWFNVSYGKLDKLTEYYNTVSALDTEISGMGVRVNNLSVVDTVDIDSIQPLMGRLDTLRNIHNELMDVITRESEIQYREENVKEIPEPVLDEISSGIALLSGEMEIQKSLESVDESIKQIELRLTEGEWDFSGDLKSVSELMESISSLSDIASDLDYVKESIDIKKHKVSDLKESLKEVEGILAEVDVCPLCGSKLK